MRRWIKILGIVAVVVLLLVLGTGLWLRSLITGSLPQLEGEVRIAGLSSDVTIERDALGVPTIRGDNRLDVARGLGFVHAQERFFQMDLLRRQGAAGGRFESMVRTGPPSLVRRPRHEQARCA